MLEQFVDEDGRGEGGGARKSFCNPAGTNHQIQIREGLSHKTSEDRVRLQMLYQRHGRPLTAHCPCGSKVTEKSQFQIIY